LLVIAPADTGALSVVIINGKIIRKTKVSKKAPGRVPRFLLAPLFAAPCRVDPANARALSNAYRMSLSPNCFRLPKARRISEKASSPDRLLSSVSSWERLDWCLVDQALQHNDAPRPQSSFANSIGWVAPKANIEAQKYIRDLSTFIAAISVRQRPYCRCASGRLCNAWTQRLLTLLVVWFFVHLC
jgi:hypothetical protein